MFCGRLKIVQCPKSRDPPDQKLRKITYVNVERETNKEILRSIQLNSQSTNFHAPKSY